MLPVVYCPLLRRISPAVANVHPPGGGGHRGREVRTHRLPAQGTLHLVSAVRVLVADDHLAFAEAVAECISAQPDLSVVGIATSLGRAGSLLASTRPDVIVVDVAFDDGNGTALLDRLSTDLPGAAAVVVAGHWEPEPAAALVRVHPEGLALVGKDGSTDDLLAAVRAAARGEAWIQPGLLGGLLAELARGPEPQTHEQQRLSLLTSRERDVLQCIVNGMDRGAIARTLFLSKNTVRTHCRNLLAKLDVHSTLEAAALARRAGLTQGGAVGRS